MFKCLVAPDYAFTPDCQHYYWNKPFSSGVNLISKKLMPL